MMFNIVSASPQNDNMQKAIYVAQKYSVLKISQGLDMKGRLPQFLENGAIQKSSTKHLKQVVLADPVKNSLGARRCS